MNYIGKYDGFIGIGPVNNSSPNDNLLSQLQNQGLINHLIVGMGTLMDLGNSSFFNFGTYDLYGYDGTPF
jgi:hypothetical protein